MVRIMKSSDNTSAYVNEYVADEESDIASLPTDTDKVYPGSTCIVIATSEVYMLNNKGE